MIHVVENSGKDKPWSITVLFEINVLAIVMPVTGSPLVVIVQDQVQYPSGLVLM